MRKQKKRCLQLATAMAASLLALWAAEFVLLSIERGQTFQAAVERQGREFDARNKLEVIDTLRADGKSAFPSLRIRAESETGLVPLSGISKVWTVQANESGQFPVFFSDEFGFNNPPGWSRETGKRTIALIGDSFVQGAGVGPEENLQAQLGSMIDSQNWQVVGLGIGGASSLAELGMVVEYLRILRPEIVLWCYYHNDLDKIQSEYDSTLRSYLENPSFSQNLWERQSEVDAMGKTWVESEERIARRKAISKTNRKNSGFQWIKIPKVRQRLRMLIQRPQTTATNSNLESEWLPVFDQILGRAHDEVTQWNGELIFVHLPAYHKNTKTGETDESIQMDAQVMQLAKERGLEVIDLHREAFLPAGNPKSFYPVYMTGHFNTEGYRLAAERMFHRIQRKTQEPPPSVNPR